MLTQYARIAMHRFGYGIDKESLTSLNNASLSDAQRWLTKQLTTYSIEGNDWSSQQALIMVPKQRQQRKEAAKADAEAESKQPKNPQMNPSMSPRQNERKREGMAEKISVQRSARKLAEAIARQAVTTHQPLQARLLDFFANHFSVTRNNIFMAALSPTLDKEAIAPNLTGTFAEMLVAVTKHPAMLYYLNNERSIGPNSRLGQRRKQRDNAQNGLNENLAREILELHTLGVDAGYKQGDVIELARALTGWSVGNLRRGESAGFKFRLMAHEPGQRKIMGKTYSAQQQGKKLQAQSILEDLAVHSNTAKHVSYKLARHFINDTPSEALVSAMQQNWLASKGNIKSVVTTMIMHPDSWNVTDEKLKTPREFVISTCRTCNFMLRRPDIFQSLELMGQAMYNAGSPAGYPDTAQEWSGPSALMARIEWAQHYAKQYHAKATTSPFEFAKSIFGEELSGVTAMHLRGAESISQAWALLLMSPEFQRR